MLYGVDVHPRYQAGINFDTLKAQGYSFAAVKASQGTTLTVVQFADWIGRVRNAGMVPGAYHWIVAGNGAAQARYFFDRLKPVGGPEGLLIQLDCEDTATWTDVTTWCAEWQQLSQGHPFLIYTGGWWWRPKGWDGASLTPYLWDSHYLSADLDTVPDNPAAFAARIPADWWTPNYGNWKFATFLQFTSKGDAGGLGNNVDLNATRLAMDQLLALTTSEDDMALTAQEHARLLNLSTIDDYVYHRGADEIPPGKLLDDTGKPIDKPWDLRPYWARIAAEVAKNPGGGGLPPHTHDTAGKTGPAVPTTD